MIGATDGGAYIEALRTGRMKPGRCEIQADGCEGCVKHLEFHHENYDPARGLWGCHHCHNLAHFRPWLLTREQKIRLLAVRFGPLAWGAMQKSPALVDRLVLAYVAPGRRKAQLEVRAKVKQMAEIHRKEVAETRKKVRVLMSFGKPARGRDAGSSPAGRAAPSPGTPGGLQLGETGSGGPSRKVREKGTGVI